MKRFAFVLSVSFLIGCAQVFDGNLFQAIDTPPPLNASSLGKASVSEIKSRMTDDSFYEQLKKDPEALAAVQKTLKASFSTVTATSTAAEKAAAVEAAQTFVMVTAFGSEAGAVANDAINQASNLVSGGKPEDAVKNLLAGKSEAQVTTLLTQFQEMNSAFTAMQTASTVDAKVDSNTFFGTTEEKGDLAQVALVSGAASALVADNGDAATVAATVTSGGTPKAGANTQKMADALEGKDTNPTTNNYAYLATVTDILPF